MPDEEEIDPKLFYDDKDRPIGFRVLSEGLSTEGRDKLIERIKTHGGRILEGSAFPRKGYILGHPDSDEYTQLQLQRPTLRFSHYAWVDSCIAIGWIVPTFTVPLFLKKDGKPISMFLHKKLTGLDDLLDKIQSHAGIIEDKELEDADVVILMQHNPGRSEIEHRAKAVATPAWVYTCIKTNKCDLEDLHLTRAERAPAPSSDVHATPERRSERSSSPLKQRNHFTTEEDLYLARYLAVNIFQMPHLSGNEIYKYLVQTEDWAHRHSWHSWRERYVRHKEPFLAAMRREWDKLKEDKDDDGKGDHDAMLSMRMDHEMAKKTAKGKRARDRESPMSPSKRRRLDESPGRRVVARSPARNTAGYRPSPRARALFMKPSRKGKERTRTPEEEEEEQDIHFDQDPIPAAQTGEDFDVSQYVDEMNSQRYDEAPDPFVVVVPTAVEHIARAAREAAREKFQMMTSTPPPPRMTRRSASRGPTAAVPARMTRARSKEPTAMGPPPIPAGMRRIDSVSEVERQLGVAPAAGERLPPKRMSMVREDSDDDNSPRKHLSSDDEETMFRLHDQSLQRRSLFKGYAPGPSKPLSTKPAKSHEPEEVSFENGATRAKRASESLFKALAVRREASTTENSDTDAFHPQRGTRAAEYSEATKVYTPTPGTRAAEHVSAAKAKRKKAAAAATMIKRNPGRAAKLRR